MSVRGRRGWELPESRATPEAVYLNRRNLIIAGGVVAAGAIIGGVMRSRGAAGQASPFASSAAVVDPSRGLYPAARNPRYETTRAITPEEINTTTNNFYEFGTSKSIAREAENLITRPWLIRIDGLVEKEFTLGIDDLLRRVDLEERVYRHRCVEGWSMVVPWTGFPLKALVAIAKPLGSAKYLRMESFSDASMASGLKQSWYPWPYVEGLSAAEATSELAFLVTGAYGKPVAKSMGAPIRVHLPWKYGFKSAKSLVRFSFVEDRPLNFWQALNPNEYGFWANVNPDVPHPRWSQQTERDIATDERRPTVLFNGYGEFVADLYSGLEDEPLFM
jgi:sulfoxide reductase catalytic subunit YedY